MKYLQGMAVLPLTLEADGTNIMKTWVDALFAVHCDMHSQTGGILTLEKGTVYGTSMCQKLNT